MEYQAQPHQSKCISLIMTTDEIAIEIKNPEIIQVDSFKDILFVPICQVDFCNNESNNFIFKYE